MKIPLKLLVAFLLLASTSVGCVWFGDDDDGGGTDVVVTP